MGFEQDNKEEIWEKLNEFQPGIISRKSVPTNVAWNETHGFSASPFFSYHHISCYILLHCLASEIATYNCYQLFHHIETQKSIQVILRFSLDDDLHWCQYDPTIELPCFLQLKVYIWIQSHRACYKNFSALPKLSTQAFRSARDEFASTTWL